ncbi:hypothetical protein, partial [Saccharothrix sp. NRRL B-16348]|uniref:hypothetical protein n=1 Tax=Saccharothrix sp. NRRL B-16348 TaxID=1415542 RepID=UPI000AEAD518
VQHRAFHHEGAGAVLDRADKARCRAAAFAFDGVAAIRELLAATVLVRVVDPVAAIARTPPVPGPSEQNPDQPLPPTR